MDPNTASPAPTRPQHRRNASSKSNILKSLVTSRPRLEQSKSENSPLQQRARTTTLPLLPADHPHAAKDRVFGERSGNMQSPPSSPLKNRPKRMAASKTSNDLAASQINANTTSKEAVAPKNSRSSTNLAAVFRKNRSSKDLSQPVQKDKENVTPPSSANGPANAPIWAQFASTANSEARPSTRDSKSSLSDIQDEIVRYTPREYSPSKQRNFNGSFEQPQSRPTLANRPQSMYAMGADIAGVIGRRVSGDRTSLVGRKSEDLDRGKSKDKGKPHDPSSPQAERLSTARKTSASSAEQATAKEKLNITKRGGRVMAAVAALQGKNKGQPLKLKDETPLDAKAVDEAFEAVLDSRNVPEPMRQKMRSLTMRVKADFIKQEHETSKTTTTQPSDADGRSSTSHAKGDETQVSPTECKKTEDDSKSTKRSRARSRTFTFSKGDKDKGGDASPSKRQRSSSKSRSTSTHQAAESTSGTPTTPRSSMDKRRSGVPAIPAEFITYLRHNQNPVEVEVGRLHKLRILLRNETVTWVDTFVSLGGFTEIVGLLHRTIDIEWREEHEDQLLHETLLCLKGLCTTGRAMSELEKVADTLFPALIGMLYDDEKKGPADYTTRTIIVTILFNFLSAATADSQEALEQRARRVLAYLGEPAKADDARPVNFVLDMRISRPYKLWCREVTHVTKEVFWIFLHHLNVVPLSKNDEAISPADSIVGDGTEERAKALALTYSQRHFPGIRPPVPAAPYIGGVEWDATTYITAHLDLLNGLIVSLPTSAARNALRAELQASGFEKVLGATLRTCKEKFYAGVHDGLRAWVAAAAEDGWETAYVREGPTQEEQARGYSPKKSPKKKDVAPKLDLPIGDAKNGSNDGGDDDWLG